VPEKFYTQNQLRDYSSLFSRGEAQAWLKKNFDSIDLKIRRYDDNWLKLKKATYVDYLKHVYKILEDYYQNEYVFKNTFLNEWLIRELGQNGSKVFNEFRVGNAVADLVIFNGHSKAFEIKTEYDSKSRLKLQLENYSKAFNQIFLIVPESKISLYEGYNTLGLISYRKDFNQKLTLIRDAEVSSVVDAEVIMHILHTQEYKNIVELYYGSLPQMTSFNQFRKCFKLIEKMPNEELNRHFIRQMKKRDLDYLMSRRYYKELNQLSLALRLNKQERNDLIQNLKTSLNTNT